MDRPFDLLDGDFGATVGVKVGDITLGFGAVAGDSGRVGEKGRDDGNLFAVPPGENGPGDMGLFGTPTGENGRKA